MYQNYIKKVSDRFAQRFDEIDPYWNFDQGNEFEVVLATLLSDMLPTKYGVCRGFVTPRTGDPKGDDVIIYDQISAPLVRPPSQYRFTRKENVPLEAVYAYIEAKNTLELVDEAKGTHISNAIRQAQQVKELIREPRDLNQIGDNARIGPGFNIEAPRGYPPVLNPMFTVIFARGVRMRGALINDSRKIAESMEETIIQDVTYPPDLIVLGRDVVVIPVAPNPAGGVIYESPFYVDGRSELVVIEKPGLAYGIGLTSLLHALQWIVLGKVPWKQVIGEVLTQP